MRSKLRAPRASRRTLTTPAEQLAESVLSLPPWPHAGTEQERSGLTLLARRVLTDASLSRPGPVESPGPGSERLTLEDVRAAYDDVWEGRMTQNDFRALLAQGGSFDPGSERVTHKHLEIAQPSVAPPGEYRIVPFGFLTGLNIQFPEQENMDAANPWLVMLRIRRHRGGAEPIPTVVAVCRDLRQNERR